MHLSVHFLEVFPKNNDVSVTGRNPLKPFDFCKVTTPSVGFCGIIKGTTVRCSSVSRVNTLIAAGTILMTDIGFTRKLKCSDIHKLYDKKKKIIASATQRTAHSTHFRFPAGGVSPLAARFNLPAGPRSLPAQNEVGAAALHRHSQDNYASSCDRTADDRPSSGPGVWSNKEVCLKLYPTYPSL